MPCTFKPMQAYGASRSSFLQRLRIGDVWSFLRDLVQNVMLRADFYDGEGNFYHGLANAIGGEGTILNYADDLGPPRPGSAGTLSSETFNDYWQENPQTEEMVLAPGVTVFVRSMPRYKISSAGSAWSENGTHKEMVLKVRVNDETWYGRTALFSENVDSATWLPHSGGGIDSFVKVQNAIMDINNRLADQGILRAVGNGDGGPG